MLSALLPRSRGELSPALVLPLNQNISAVTRLVVPGRGRGGEQSSTGILFGWESESNSTISTVNFPHVVLCNIPPIHDNRNILKY